MPTRFLTSVLLLIALISGGVWLYPTSNAVPVCTIQAGLSGRAIAHELVAQGVIRQTSIFRVVAKLTGKQIQAGRYALPPRLSWARLFRIITGQEFAARAMTVTLVPGMALPEIAQELARLDGRDPTHVIHYVRTQAKADLIADYPRLADNPTPSLEGYFFPDTYTVAYDTPTATLVRLWVDRLYDQLYPIFENQAQALYTFHEYLTLASIVEKEGAVVDEFANIAAVFHNRMRQRKRLESCPTVAYALGEYRKSVITYADTQVKSAYNTYRVAGLPPTPIAIASPDAFRAAVYPTPAFPYLYFVADKQQRHYFSKTYADHLKKQQYAE